MQSQRNYYLEAEEAKNRLEKRLEQLKKHEQQIRENWEKSKKVRPLGDPNRIPLAYELETHYDFMEDKYTQYIKDLSAKLDKKEIFTFDDIWAIDEKVKALKAYVKRAKVAVTNTEIGIIYDERYIERTKSSTAKVTHFLSEALPATESKAANTEEATIEEPKPALLPARSWPTLSRILSFPFAGGWSGSSPDLAKVDRKAEIAPSSMDLQRKSSLS